MCIKLEMHYFLLQENGENCVCEGAWYFSCRLQSLTLQKSQTDCLCCCCLNWGPARVQSYNDLEELLFDVDETAAGRLVVPGVEEDGDAAAGEITVGNFFCDVLKQKPKRPTVARRQEESMDQSGSRFSEPLL